MVTGCSRTQVVFDCLAHSFLLPEWLLLRHRGRTRTIAGRKFYAIVGGRNGFNGVVTDWEHQARPLTQGVSRVQHKRFSTVVVAKRYVSDRTGIPEAQVQVYRFLPQLQQGVQAQQLAGVVVQLGQAGVAAPAPGEQGGPDIER